MRSLCDSRAPLAIDQERSVRSVEQIREVPTETEALRKAS